MDEEHRVKAQLDFKADTALKMAAHERKGAPRIKKRDLAGNCGDKLCIYRQESYEDMIRLSAKDDEAELLPDSHVRVGA